jgi:poly(3-hydroxybutyrate) depolymerase
MLEKIAGFILFFGLTIINTANAQVLNGKEQSSDSIPQNDTLATAKDKQYTAANFTGRKIRDVVYSPDTSVSGNQQAVTMDVYMPPNPDGKKFPLVFLIHGGGFRSGDKTQMASECFGLAENGYVAISINYRLGWENARIRGGCDDTMLIKQAIYRTVQDANTALRYSIVHADEYAIDKDWIFIGGNSAGAITALFTAYLTQKSEEDFFNGFAETLGALKQPGNNSDASYKLRGVLSMWGAFLDPALINSSNALPTLFFQGEKDPIVPFNVGHLIGCPYSTAYGTYPLYNRLKDLGETVIAHIDPNGGHGVFSLNFRLENTLCFLNDVRQGIKKQEYLTGTQNSCD